MISFSELADQARVTVDELRARLHHAGIGASGHGAGWEARVRGLVGEIVKENGGVAGGQVVSSYASDNLAVLDAAEEELRKLVAKLLRESTDSITIVHEGTNQRVIRGAPEPLYMIWRKKGLGSSPEGAITNADNSEHGMSWQLYVSLFEPHPAAEAALDNLPSHIHGIEIHTVDWAEKDD